MLKLHVVSESSNTGTSLGLFKPASAPARGPMMLFGAHAGATTRCSAMPLSTRRRKRTPWPAPNHLTSIIGVSGDEVHFVWDTFNGEASGLSFPLSLHRSWEHQLKV